MQLRLLRKKQVYLTRTLHEFAIKRLREKYNVEIHSGKIPIPMSKLQSKIKEIDGLICFPYDKIDAGLMRSANNLKIISTFSVGFDHIDIEFAKKNKIRVGYTPKVLTDATADLTFALIMDLSRRVSEGDRLIRAGRWSQIFGAHDYVGMDLEGKTIGILGLGRIGKSLVKRAKAFDMKVIYHNRKQLANSTEKALGVEYVSFNKLISKSDIVSIHTPLTKSTEGIFDMKIFRKMKNSAILINTSRGKIINEKDLVTVLRKKIISGAALDVFHDEPLNKKHPFLKMQNVVLTPHIGSSSRETREKMAEITIKNLELGMADKRPLYSVGY